MDEKEEEEEGKSLAIPKGSLEWRMTKRRVDVNEPQGWLRGEDWKHWKHIFARQTYVSPCLLLFLVSSPPFTIFLYCNGFLWH